MKYLWLLLLATLLISCENVSLDTKIISENKEEKFIFTPPDTSTIPNDIFGEAVRYGRKLILSTAYYIGPEGINGKYLGNKMNCTNCHLEAGTRPFGFNYFSTHARYPQYRSRENKILTLADRVNNCIERPHSGKPLPHDSKEMIAIVSYIQWLGKGVPTGEHVGGDNQIEMEFPDQKASSDAGSIVYAEHCKSCHGANGEGKMFANNITFEYPPLWGPRSYQAGSSLHRVIKAARFIKANMPNSTTWRDQKLTTQQALDVAAFINDDKIHQRPQPENLDYPDAATKPIDYGLGPYIDPFTAEQHKFGPFPEIIAYKKKNNQKIVF